MADKKSFLPKFYGNTVHVIGTIITTLAVGLGTYSHLDEQHDTSAAKPQLEADSIVHLRDMADDIIKHERRILYYGDMIDTAKSNIGKTPGDWSQQFTAVQTEYDKLTVERDAQNGRLEKYRNEILFNPALSEQKGDAIYTEFYYKASDLDLHRITNFFSPFTDALKYRDECKVQFGAAAATPETGAALSKKIVACGRDTDAAANSHEVNVGLTAGALTLAFGILAPLVPVRRRKPKPEQNGAKVTINVIRK